MSVEGSEFMIMLLGWILFLVTLQIAIWRDVVRENLAETRAKEDLEFLRIKQAEWQAEKQDMQDRIGVLALSIRLENAGRSLSGNTK